jgi:hypothetical protein
MADLANISVVAVHTMGNIQTPIPVLIVPDMLVFPTPSPPPPDDPPEVGGFSPALGASIDARDVISFHVLPGPAALLQRVTIIFSFPLLGLTEVAFDGDSFTQAYPATQGNARVANGDGWDFTILRKEGWPASPKVIPIAVDEFGNMNPIDSVNYAWTLVN